MILAPMPRVFWGLSYQFYLQPSSLKGNAVQQSSRGTHAMYGDIKCTVVVCVSIGCGECKLGPVVQSLRRIVKGS